MKLEQMYRVLLKPIWTEKTANMPVHGNWYAFEVQKTATKPLVAKAIQSIYTVDVEAVNIVNKRTRYERNFRGTWRKKAGIKKAYVKLRLGQTINIEGR